MERRDCNVPPKYMTNNLLLVASLLLRVGMGEWVRGTGGGWVEIDGGRWGGFQGGSRGDNRMSQTARGNEIEKEREERRRRNKDAWKGVQSRTLGGKGKKEGDDEYLAVCGSISSPVSDVGGRGRLISSFLNGIREGYGYRGNLWGSASGGGRARGGYWRDLGVEGDHWCSVVSKGTR